MEAPRAVIREVAVTGAPPRDRRLDLRAFMPLVEGRDRDVVGVGLAGVADLDQEVQAAFELRGRILLVEANRVNQLVARRLLEKRGGASGRWRR